MAVPDGLEVAERVPQAFELQSESAQVTPRFLGSLATVAVKVWLWPGWTVTDAGETDTEAAA